MSSSMIPYPANFLYLGIINKDKANHYEPTTPVAIDSEPENTLPEPPIGNMESSTQESTENDDDSKHQSKSDPDWLSRMQV